MMIKEAIATVVDGKDLQPAQMRAAMEEVMSGQATPAQIGAFMTALRMKGESMAEIAAAADVMRRRAVKVNVALENNEAQGSRLLDTCGTGGDGADTFNVSTATALVAAGGGVTVAKHGGRAVSSRCGSADVLKELGVELDLDLSSTEECIRRVGIGFLYAPLYHRAMRHAAMPRQEVGLRSIFNLLGPLTNPAGASAQLLGVYAPELTQKLAGVLGRLGSREAFVVYGEGSFDEISICGPTQVAHLKAGSVRCFEIRPEDFGFKCADPKSIRGGSPRDNAQIIRHVLEGHPGPPREMVLLNAAAAFVAAGLEDDFPAGLDRAQDAVDSGKARAKLDQLVAFTRRCRPGLQALARSARS